jgi:hypothetical protein
MHRILLAAVEGEKLKRKAPVNEVFGGSGHLSV